MEFGILIFQTDDHVELFLTESEKLKVEGIDLEKLAKNILLVTRTKGVSPEDWGRFKSVGFRKICGNWVSNWHEEKELRDGFIETAQENGQPFVEAFWGDNACIVATTTPELS